MTYHKPRTPGHTGWVENKERLALALRQHARTVQEQILAQLDEEFTTAEAEGRTVNYYFTPEDVRGLFERAVLKQVEAP